MNENMPPTRDSFESYLRHYFPNVLDIKSFMGKFSYYGGLEKLAWQLEIVREGSQHQAGSDSRVTSHVFFSMFNNMSVESDIREYQSVYIEHNLDIYGFSNEQAYGMGFAYDSGSIQIDNGMRGMGNSGYNQNQDMHGHPPHISNSSMGGHGHIGHGHNNNGLMMDQGDNENEFFSNSGHANDLQSLIGGEFRPNNGIPGLGQFN